MKLSLEQILFDLYTYVLTLIIIQYNTVNAEGQTEFWIALIKIAYAWTIIFMVWLKYKIKSTHVVMIYRIVYLLFVQDETNKQCF